MTSAPPPRGQLVGSALRQYREAAGYSLAGAARLLECGPLKISRIEAGERGVYERELRGLLTGYGVDAAVQDVLAAAVRPRRTHGWQARYRGLLAEDHLAFLAAESAARSICAYAPVQLPALLHSTAYARAAAAADPGTSPDEVETIVQATYDRQQAVLREQDTLVTVIIGEAALRQHAGNAAMMRAQYRRLVTLAAASAKVTLYVLPFTAGPLAAGGGGGFTILQFGQPPEPGLVQLAGLNGGTCLHAPRAVAAYLTAFTYLLRAALPPKASIHRIRQLADSLRNPRGRDVTG